MALYLLNFHKNIGSFTTLNDISGIQCSEGFRSRSERSIVLCAFDCSPTLVSSSNVRSRIIKLVNFFSRPLTCKSVKQRDFCVSNSYGNVLLDQSSNV